jgi:hypothetical protein
MPTLRTIHTGGTPRPFNHGVPTLSGTAQVGQTLTCNPGYWVGKGLTFSYQWIRGASTVIDGATSATYELAGADEGLTVKCQVTATSADANYGTRTAVTAASSTVLAA